MNRLSTIFWGIGTALLTALFLCIIVGVLIFFIDISNESMHSIFIIINYISIGLGAMIAAGKGKQKGWLYGGAVGIIYIILIAFIAQSISPLTISIHIAGMRALFGCLTGMGTGVIGVNLSEAA